MIDTVRLLLSDYAVEPGARLTVQPAAYQADTGERQLESVLWSSGESEVRGAKAYLNTERLNLTLQPFNRSGDSLLFGETPPAFAHVSFSVPKAVTGSNVAPVGRDGTAEAFSLVEQELREAGVSTNIRQALVTRADLFRNVQTSEAFASYAPLFSVLGAKRMERRDYGSTFLWHNTLREFCVYDKCAETAAAGGSTETLPANLMRFEYRLLQRKKVVSELEVHSVEEILKSYRSLSGAYRGAMRDGLFSFAPAEVEAFSGKRLEAEMRVFMESYGRNWLERYLEAVGAARIAEHANIETVKTIVERLSGNRLKAWRLGKRLAQYKLDLEVIREAAPPVSLRSLYEELSEKVLA